jgi:integrase/recombinase XerD
VYPDDADPQPADNPIELFLDAIWVEQGLSENTLRAYRSDLQIFHRWLNGRKPLLEATQDEITALLAHRYQAGMSSRTSARLLSSLKRFYGYYLRESRIDADPTALISAPQIAPCLTASPHRTRGCRFTKTPLNPPFLVACVIKPCLKCCMPLA